MTKITLPDTVHPLLCTTALRGTAPADAIVLVIQGQPYVIGVDLFSRAASTSADAIFEGGTLAIGLHRRDGERLSAAGFTQEWAARFQGHLRLVMSTFQAERGAGFVSATVRWASAGPSAQDRARATLREIALTAGTAGLGAELRFGVTDLQSFTGLRDALWEVCARLTVPEFRQALLGRGISEASLAALPGLGDAMFEERQAQLLAQGEQVGTTGALAALKAMALGDMTMLSRTAKAQLPAERAERYQLGKLLGTGTRRVAPEPEEPATPVTGTTPVTATTPIGATPATHGATPVTPAGATPAPHGAPAGTTSRPAQPALPALVPGTVLYTTAAAGGPPVSLVVQPDGSFAWLPNTGVAAPAPIAPPVLAPLQPAQPAPARRTRRR